VTLLKYFSNPSVSYFFPNPPIKLGLQIGERILITTYLNQSNYLATTTTRLASRAPQHCAKASEDQCCIMDVSVSLGVKKAE
jgi:hypothetical protein